MFCFSELAFEEDCFLELAMMVMMIFMDGKKFHKLARKKSVIVLEKGGAL